MLKSGITNQKTLTVNESNTAKAHSSGNLDVFATPALAALMENVCLECVQPYLENGQETVGISLNIRHLSATPVGMTVNAICTLTEIDGRRLVFNVEASDNAGLIGDGIHERFIVNAEKFMSKANEKLKI